MQNANSAFVSAFCAANGIPVSATGAFWYFVNQAIQTVGYGELSYNDLLAISIRFNDAFNDNSGGVWEAIFQNCRAFITNSIALCFGLSEVNFVVEEWGTSGFYRIRETKTGLWVVNSSAYTPTAVPVDTNLALVLPGESIPLADEYWEFTTDDSVTPIVRYDFSEHLSLDGINMYTGTSASDYLYLGKVEESIPYYSSALGKLYLSELQSSYGYQDGVFYLEGPSSVVNF